MLPMGKEKNSYLPELTHNLSQEKIGPEGNHSPCVTFLERFLLIGKNHSNGKETIAFYE